MEEQRQPDSDAGTTVVQHVLAAVEGNHALMNPLRDGGELVDFRIDAASETARDVAGRRGKQLLGVCIRQAYPLTIRGDVWETFGAVLADGIARTLGPFPYPGPLTSVPSTLRITMSLRRVAGGVLTSWTHSEDRDRLEDRIAQTERLGNLGWSEQDLLTGVTTWSDQLYRIYGRDPAAGPLSPEESEAITVPEDRPLRRRVAEELARGVAADIRYRIRTPEGVKHIRVVADTVRDMGGRPLRAYGIVQDVTTRETNRAKIAKVERQLHENRLSLAAEHRLAAELQEIILPIPMTPIDLPGLRAAIRYLPAEQASRIGGDWYHAATAYDGSVVLAIGDVAGHGLRAAATMAQLRHAFATLASTATTDPAELLVHLNRLLHANDRSEAVASAIAARFDPATGRLRWAQAGHPGPLHTRGGVTAELDRPAGALLGAMPAPQFETAEFPITHGDLLVFYTDGLVERRGHPREEGLRPIMATLNELSAAASPQPLADLVARLDRANPDDDTCVLAVRPLAGT